MIPPRQTPIFLVLAGAALFAAGCATPGALHIYSLPASPSAFVHDQGPDSSATVPSFLAPGETLTGFAYDPFTDHFFLRLAPGNRIRVVDRPARAVKREFIVAGLPATGGGDLAVRPRNGHLFLVHPTEGNVFEVTRLGKWVRTIQLEGTTTPAQGLAYDSAQDRLLVVMPTAPARIAAFDLEGHPLRSVTLARNVGSSLAFDSETREFYAPLADRPMEVGVFDETGHLRRTHAMPASFVDVGPRSFLRLF